MKIYYKLNLLIIFLLVTLTLIVTASVSVMMNDALEQEMMERELTIAEYVTEDLANPLLQKDTIEVNEIIDNVMVRNTDIRYVYVVGFDGVVVTHTFSQGFPADMVTANPIPPNENTAVRILSVDGESIQDVGVRVLDGMDAKVYFGFSRANLISSINRTTRTIVSTAALVLLFGVLLSFFLTRTLTSPIEKLVAGTNRVAEGDLDFQVEVTTSDDIGVLADSFNRMVAERKQAEEQLNMFKTFAETSNQGMGWADIDGNIVYVNSALSELFGEKDQKVPLGKNVAATYYPEDEQQRLREEIFPSVVKNGAWSGELMMQQTSEKLIPTHNSLFLIRNEASEPIFFANIVTDITEHKQDEEKLKASEDKYSTLVEKGNDGIIIIQDFVLKFVNSRMIELTGLTKEEVIGKPFYDYVSPEYKEMLTERVKKRLKGEAVPRRYEIDILSKDGSTIPVEINASLIEYAGRPADMAIIRDITERRQAEAEVKKLNEELEQRVKDRTAELEDKNDELERMNKLFVGRELRMAELKEQISGLEEKHRGSDSIT